MTTTPGPAPEDVPEPVGRYEQITDLARLRAFMNPLRMRLYRLLYAEGQATASQLADQVDETPSLVSYHLRKLADHGFVTGAEGRGADGRERWWQVASEGGWGFRESDFADSPEGAAAVGAVTRGIFDTRVAQYRTYLDQKSAWGKEWSDASFSSEWMLDLTPAELAEMSDELEVLARRWRERGKAAKAAEGADGRADGGTAGRERVSVHLYGFPFRP
ncbi:helix-turn-helix domain-containing protein [Streptomyces sp. NPDC089919]|uniref:helix-turn-helix domain-containing protein n=1 Tax=Streptomyces sp. NPDC089919 TaxID=3155188 RepID=UPI0034289DCC